MVMRMQKMLSCFSFTTILSVAADEPIKYHKDREDHNKISILG
jgi:hypothetical protein